MSETNFVEQSIDRFQDAFRNVGDEVEKIQKRLEKRRKSFEKQAQKRIKRFRSDIRSNALVKRAETLQKDAAKQFESGVENVLSTLQVATARDIKKLDRKLGQLARKLSSLDKGRNSAS